MCLQHSLRVSPTEPAVAGTAVRLYSQSLVDVAGCLSLESGSMAWRACLFSIANRSMARADTRIMKHKNTPAVRPEAFVETHLGKLCVIL